MYFDFWLFGVLRLTSNYWDDVASSFMILALVYQHHKKTHIKSNKNNDDETRNVCFGDFALKKVM